MESVPLQETTIIMSIYSCEIARSSLEKLELSSKYLSIGWSDVDFIFQNSWLEGFNFLFVVFLLCSISSM